MRYQKTNNIKSHKKRPLKAHNKPQQKAACGMRPRTVAVCDLNPGDVFFDEGRKATVQVIEK